MFAVPPAPSAIPEAILMPMRFDAVALRKDLEGFLAGEFVPHFNVHQYAGDWSAIPLRSVGGSVDQIFPDPEQSQAFADTPWMERCPGVRAVLEAFPCPLLAVRFLRLKAGSIIKEHRDYELGFDDGEVRLHVPVMTNPEVEFVLNGNRIVMQEGECWYVNVNFPHKVANRGETDRVHLVIDCAVDEWLRALMLREAGAISGNPPVHNGG
ncbi:MAG TPA: aspartyl/asparaginyl beta-hydroxylase domain-containing protein [Verrucomicrobiales bacterium]|jgi:hypothetical protein|nr:aspartyl/asparaginyl beta-hydroxylase domain-containing protein [Verrucomicrobiales bacterium]